MSQLHPYRTIHPCRHSATHRPWVLPSVQEARRIINEKGLLHEYLPILGLKGLRQGAARLVFGEEYAAISEKLATSQAISGTGSLHLAGALLKYCTPKAKGRDADAVRNVYIPSPTWSNHHLLFSSLGFEVIPFDSRIIPPVWTQVPSNGKKSAASLKTGGYFRERVGALIVSTADPVVAKNTQSVLESLQRSEISNPPAFGAKIAETVLSDDQLRSIWFEDLKTMSGRIAEMRRALFEGLNRYSPGRDWGHVLSQSGMFGFLGLEKEVVRVLKDEYHICMAENSRVLIAGLNTGNVEYVARSIGEVLSRGQ
ncbi:pyridoxal phosphate-dependent transferase [Aspergillus recurvatus]